MTSLPKGFNVHVANMGVKDETNDVMLLTCDVQAKVSAVFTQSLFAGPSIVLSREHAQSGTSRAVVVVSKNANVATGAIGTANANELAALVGASVQCEPTEVLVGSTGVIGVQYPMDRIREHFVSLVGPFDSVSAEDAATAIMTTDTHPKIASTRVGEASIVGIAKGVGMIEPNMATMIAVIMTDAELSTAELDLTFKKVVGTTFNALSIDTDTSTSDMALVLSSGHAGNVNSNAFEDGLRNVCLELTRQLASDGEGAETLIVVTVDQAESSAQAKKIAKSIVNSPLVKTAVHGCDPNWGRVAMAIGKCEEETGIDQNAVVIKFGEHEVYPNQANAELLKQLEKYLNQDEILIHVSLQLGTEQFTAYGCDLTDGYVRINADYTT